MCFYLSSKHPKRKKATEDIVCWKCLRLEDNGILHSPYLWYPYKLGKLIKSKLGSSKYGEIEEGLHTYSTRNRALDQKKMTYSVHRWVIKKAIIPAGSYYWYNEKKKEYVSTKLIVGKLKK